MEKFLRLNGFNINRAIVFIALMVFGVSGLQAQVTLDKTIVPSQVNCNEFNVQLTVEGAVAPVIPVEVVLVIDRSGSMDDNPGNGDDLPIEYAQDAAIDFVNELFLPVNNPTGLNRVALVTYSTSATVDQGFVLVADKQDIIDAIDDINTGGGTNIARAMDTADTYMTNNATFDCDTQRSIIMLTDGITNRRFLGGSSCNPSSPAPPYPANATACMTEAVAQGQEAWTTTVSGELYNQQVYSVGLFGAISGNAQTAATWVLDELQNEGLFVTESGANLNAIYQEILGQLGFSAKDAVVTDVLPAGFGANSLVTADGTAIFDGVNTITWSIGNVSFEEVVTLDYVLTTDNAQSCGDHDFDNSIVNFENAVCDDVQLSFPTPSICVPCPSIGDPTIEQVECTNFVDYSATFDPGDCTPFVVEFTWEFFLNGDLVGTIVGDEIADLTGQFEYTGVDPFEGDFQAVLSYDGTYNNNCSLPVVEVDSTIQVNIPPDSPMSGGDQAECAEPVVQTLTATATVPAGVTVVWYDAPVDGNPVVDPSLSAVGTVTYYAEAMRNGTSCGSTARTAVTLTIYDCSMDIVKIALNETTPPDCTALPEGETIDYQFTVTNNGTVGIENIEVTDLLISPTPLTGPDSGDDNNNDILDVGESWVYTASYVVTQADIIAGQVENTVAVNGSVTGSSASYNVDAEDTQTVELCQNAEIMVVKSSSLDTGNCENLKLNDLIDYTFLVSNEGDVDITNVVLTDALLGGTVPGPDSGDAVDPGVLNVGETWTYTANYSVTQADIDAGVVSNTATVDGSTALGAVQDDSDQVDVEICQNPAIAIVKSANYDDGGDCSQPGETINYTFTVTNLGDVSLSNVNVVDPLTGLSPISFDGGDTDNDNQLDVTETWTYSASYTITQDDIDFGSVTNQAEVTAQAPDASPVSDFSGADVNSNSGTVVALCSDAAIAIVKESSYDDGGDCSQPGELINYTFTVTNQGNVTLSGIVVTDPLLGGVVAGPDSGDDGDGLLQVDEVWVYSGSYAITQADIDAGEVSNQATAEGTAPDLSTVEDESGASVGADSPTITTLCSDAAIAIVKESSYDDGGDCSQPGELINYTFTVTNQGNVTLSGIVVTDPLLGGVVAGPDSGDDGDGLLQVNEVWVYSGSYAITQADIDAGEVSNQATAEGTAPDLSTVEDESGASVGADSPTITTLCSDAAIAIVKESSYDDGGDCSQPGELINYTFTVTNQGNVTLSNIVVTDPLLGGVVAGPDSGDDGDSLLQVNEVWVYSGSYAITQADIDAGEVSNQATAEGTAPDLSTVEDESGASVGADSPTITTLCSDAAIAIVKESSYDDGGDCSQPGELINYTFTVTNQGNVTLSNIVVTDPLLGGVVAGPDSGDDGDSLLQVDEVWVYSGSYAITQADIDAGEVSNQATAEGTAPDLSTVEDESGASVGADSPTITTLCSDAAIAIVKESSYDDGGDCSQPGELINYTFTVTNQGNVTLSGIVVTDPLLGGVVAGPDSGDDNNDGLLQVDEVWVYSGSYAITQVDIDAGEVSNQATAEGTAPDLSTVEDESGASVGADSPTITTLCSDAAIAIVKESSYDDGGDCSQPGELINYTFTVTNQGNVTLSGIVVTDPLLGGVVAGPDSGDDGDGLLQVNEVWVYSGSYAITQADIDAGEVSNQATAEGTAPDLSTVEDESGASVGADSPTITTLCSDAAIAIVKESSYDDGGDCSQPGELINYTFTVTNQGNVTLSNIVVTDPLLGGVVAGPDSGDDGDSLLQVDEVWVYSGSYAITQADIDAGEVSNQATAEGTAPDLSTVEDESGASVGADSPTITTLCSDAAIAIVKESSYDDGGDCSQPGELINYTFTVTNEGNVTLSGIVVTDPLLGGVVAGPDSGDDGDGLLQVDEVWVYSGSYAITQADIDAGEVSNQATAEGTAPDLSTVEDESGASVGADSPTITTLCSDAAIAIVKESSYDDGGDCSQPGELINYTFTVTNEGNVTLSGIVVTDPLLGGVVAGPDSGDDGDGLLQVNEVWVYSGSYAITQADIDAGEVSNQATAEGTAPDQSIVEDLSGSTTTTDDGTITTLCQDPAIAIVKESSYDDGGDCSQPGEEIFYTFTVTNEGNVTLSNIVITDPLLGGVVAGPDSGDDNNDGLLQVDEVWVYSGSYAITQADIDAGEVSNQATAEGTAPDLSTVEDESGASVGADSPTITTLCSDAAIAIVKESSYDDGGDCSQPGELINYTFTVTNQGNVTLSGIVVTDPLLGGVVAGPDSGDDGDGLLQVDEVWVYSGSYAITQADIDAGEVSNQATAEGTAPDLSTVEDESGASVGADSPTITTLCSDAAIAIVKESSYDDGGDCSQPGELINYTFTVTNQGNVTLSGIVVTDPLLGGVVAGPDSGDDGDGLLQVNEVWVYSGSYAITQADIDAGEVSNQATAEGTAPDLSTVEDESGASVGADSPTITTLCSDAAIAIVKESSYDDGGDCSQPGELINYTFTVTNQGNVTLSNIVVTDPLLGGVVAGPDSGDDGDGLLQVDEVWVYSGSYAITQADIDAGEVSNQATAEGTAPDLSTVEDESGASVGADSPTITTLCSDAAIAIVKESSYDDGGDCSQPGELINYTFTVTNQGNVTLSNIVVTDPLLGGVVAGPDSGDDGDGLLQVDEVWVYSGSYAITQADIDAGEVSNQATAEGTAPDLSTVEDESGASVGADSPTITTLCSDAAIAIVKESSYDDGGDCSQPGELINYTFTVTNQGNVTLSGIVVTDPLLGGVVAGPDSGDDNNDGLLQVDEVWVYSGSYAITQADIDAGEVSNQATAEGTAPDLSTVEDESGASVGADSPTITTLCSDAAIAIVKESSYDDGGDCSQPGELINYTFTVTNEGNVTLSNIVITDPLLGGVVAGPDSGDDGDGLLQVDEVWVYSGSYTITQADIDAGEVFNQATAEGTAPDQSVVEDLSGSSVSTDDGTITTLCQDPAIAIVKASSYDDGGDCSQPGEEIFYTFTVTNEGNVTLSNIVVTDPLLGGVVAGPDSGDDNNDGLLQVDEVWVYSGSYAITQVDIDAGEVFNQATAEGTAPDQSVVEDLSGSSESTDDGTITTLCQDPAIAIVKESSYDDGGDCSQPGELINYTFTVTNQGNVTLSNIVVADPLLGGVVAGPDSGDDNNDGLLQVDEVWVYSGSYAITQVDIDAGEVFNQATAEGTAPDLSTVEDESGATINSNDPTITTLCSDAAIAIVKESSYDDGGDCSQPGELINYTFTVTNQGNVTLSGIVVTDPLLGGVVAGPDSGDDGDGLLQVNEVWVYSGSYAITQADIDAGEVSNQATAEGTAPDQSIVEDLSGSTTTTDDGTITSLCQDPAIAIVKASSYDDGGDCSQPGEEIFYTFTLTNEGNVTLSNIVVTDPLLGGVVAGPDSGDDNNDGLLQVDEVWVYSGSYTITQADIDAGEVFNQATAEGTAPDQSIVEDLSGSTTTTDDGTITTLCQDPAIAIVKESSYDDGGDCSQPGEEIFYTFTVTNEGNVTLSNIVVTDPLLGGVVAGPDSGDDNPADGQLQVDEVWVYTGSYVITQDDIDAGEVFNQATAEGTAPDQSIVEDLSGSTTSTDDGTITTLCQDPAIAIVKEAEYDDGGDCSQPGEEIFYTFTVTNEGNVTLSNIVVTDPLLGGVVAGPDSGDDNNDGLLQVDEVWVYSGSYTITQADIDAGEVFNQATAEGTAPDQSQVSDLSGSTIQNDDTTITTLCQSPIIAIVKESSYDDDGDCSQPGELINYTFTVSNEGNVTLSNIVVTDPILAVIFVPGPDSGDDNNDGLLQVDEVWVYSGSYTITQADIDAGEVFNQATAEGTAPDQSIVEDLSGSTTTTDDGTITTLCQDPAIAIVKESSYDDGGDCSQPGEEIFYTFTVTNEGNVTLSNIVVTDPLLGGVVAGPDSGDDGDGLLQVNEVWVYSGSYAITQADIDAGEVFNQATAEGTAPDQSVVEDLSGSSVSTDDGTITTLCQDPAIAIVKASSYDDGGDCSQPGEEIFYTFTVTNEGNVTLSNIVVTDPLLGGVVAGPDSGDDNNDGLLQVDEVWVYSGSYAITQVDIDAGEVFNQATAEGTAPDQSVVEDLSGSSESTDDGTITTLCQDPAIAIVKESSYDDGGDCSQPGELINYTFTVTNEGNVTLSNIVVADPLLGGVVAGPDSGDDNNDGLLQVDEVWVYSGSYAITQVDIDAGEVFNQATAEGTAPDQSVVEDLSGSTTTTDDGTITTLCQDPAIAIVKEAEYDDGGDCSQPGEEIFYTFTVTNEGNVTLSNIVVTDPLLGGVVAGPDSGDDNPADGQLQVDEVWVYTGSYVITQDDIDAGEVFNQATAEGTAPDQSIVEDLSGSTTSTDDGTITTLCQDPAIAIVKEAEYDDGGDCSQPGEEIFYTFTVTNEGNVTLSNIVVTDPLLGGVVAGPDSGDDNPADGQLQVDEVWVYTGSYVITQDDIDAGEVFNQATAEGTAPDQSIVEDLSGSTTSTDDGTITTLCQDPAIAIVKESSYDDGGDCSQPGEEIFYTFTVTNEGNVTLSNIVVTDPLLGGVVAGPDSGDDGDGLLQVNEVWVYTGSYVITQDDIDAGEVFNQATAEGTAPDQSIVEDLSGSTTSTDDGTITTLCQDPAIAIVKEAEYDDGGDCSQPGEEIFYTFTVTNEGNVTLSNIVVTDPLLGGVVAGPVSGDDNPADGQLQVDEVWVYTGSYVITQDDIDAGEVFNQATAEGTAPDQSIVEDLSGSTTSTDDGTITTLCQDPAIAIVKEAEYDDGGDCSQPGEEIFYTFTVTNEGNVTLSNIVVTDPLLGGVVAGPVSGDDNPADGQLQVDEVWVYTGSYVITQDDIDAGEVFNQATAEGTAPDQSIVEDLSGSTTTTDDGTITTLCQDPAIAIVKEAEYDDGGDCSQPGEEIFYTFTVTNEGNVTLSNIVVTDPLLGGVVAGPVSGDDNPADGQLQVDEVWVYTGSYVITQDDIDAGEVFNQATAEGTAPDQSIVEDLSGSTTTTDDGTITTLCQDPAIAIVKEAEYDDGGDCSQPGEEIFYTFTVTNEGNVTLFDIDVDDPLLGGNVPGPDSGDTNGDGALQIDETWIYTGSYVITQDDIDAGEVFNQATAKGTAPDQSIVEDLSGSTTTTDDGTITVLCIEPSIAMIKTVELIDDDGDGCADVGESLLYTFSVLNTGNVPLTDVIVTDPLITVSGGPINLEPGEEDNTTFSGTYIVTEDDVLNVGEVVNQALVEGLDPEGNVVSDLSDDNSYEEDDPTIFTNFCVIVTSTYGVVAESVCINDVPYLSYEVTLPTSTTPGVVENVTIDWFDLDDNLVFTHTDLPLEGQVLWPGAEVDEDGNATDWPGWILVDGVWVEGDDGFQNLRPQAKITVSVEDDSDTLIVDYPPADPVCYSGPRMGAQFVKTDFNCEEPITPGSIDITISGGKGPFTFEWSTEDGEGLVPGAEDQTNLSAGTYTVLITDTVLQETVSFTIVIEQIGDCVLDAGFDIWNGVTPNGDGLNDFFWIEGIVNYPDNNLKVFNRWGVLVYEQDGYNESDRVFRGISEGRTTVRQGDELPTGTYYYVLEIYGDENPGQSSYAGYLYLNR